MAGASDETGLPPAKAVLVVGSVNVDLEVGIRRLPSPGQTVGGGTFHRAVGGKGANQASAAAKLGARTSLIGFTGDDDLGRSAREDLAAYGIDLSGLGHCEAPTGVAAILVEDEGENLIAVASGANHEVTAAHVIAQLDRIAEPGAVVLSVLELSDAAVMAAAATAREHSCRFVLDPAPPRVMPEALLARCDVLTPNEHELRALGGVDALLGLGIGAVIVTRGARGAQLHVRGRPSVHVDPFPAEVVDTTGAGDAFNGALAWAMADGLPLEEAARLACAAGALATRALGAKGSLPDRDELMALVGP
jgi:ribokinase